MTQMTQQHTRPFLIEIKTPRGFLFMDAHGQPTTNARHAWAYRGEDIQASLNHLQRLNPEVELRAVDRDGNVTHTPKPATGHPPRAPGTPNFHFQRQTLSADVHLSPQALEAKHHHTHPLVDRAAWETQMQNGTTKLTYWEFVQAELTDLNARFPH